MSVYSTATNALKDVGQGFNTISDYASSLLHPDYKPQAFSAVAGDRSKQLLGGALQTGATNVNSVANDVPTDTGPSWNDINANLLNLQKQINSSRNLAPVAPPTLPAFDVQDVFNKARTAATSAVSPYYEQTLQNFKDTQQHKRDQANQDLQSTKDIQAQDLANLQKTNESQRQRTTQDVATNQGLINAAQTAYNTNSASAFSKASDALRANQGNANTLFSGLGQQQGNDLLRDKGVQNNQQATQYQAQRNQQDLFKNRTFEDLARSEELQQQAGNRVVGNQQQQNEHTFQDMADELVQKQRDLEMSKQNDIQTNQGLQAKNMFTNYLGALRTPQQVAYANSIYAPFF